MPVVHEGLELRAEQLRRRLDPAELPFESTIDVEPLRGTIGQPRALDAIEFGLDVETFGYNLFLAGAPGSGRESTVRKYLDRFSRDRPVPDDWLYVHNVDDPDQPQAIRLPPGLGSEFELNMDEFIEAARNDIPRTFESEEYARRRRSALAELEGRREQITNELQRFAEERGFALESTPAGVATVPVADGRPLVGNELEQLSREKREDLQRRGEEIQTRVAEGLRELRRLEKEAAQRTRDLNREIAGLSRSGGSSTSCARSTRPSRTSSRTWGRSRRTSRIIWRTFGPNRKRTGKGCL